MSSPITRTNGRLVVATLIASCVALAAAALALRSGVTWHVSFDHGFVEHVRVWVLGPNGDHLSHVTRR